MGVTGNGSELHARTSWRLVAILFTLLFVAGCSDSASRPAEATLQKKVKEKRQKREKKNKS